MEVAPTLWCIHCSGMSTTGSRICWYILPARDSWKQPNDVLVDTLGEEPNDFAKGVRAEFLEH